MPDDQKHPALAEPAFLEWDDLEADQRKVVLLSPYFNNMRTLCAFADLSADTMQGSKDEDPAFAAAILTVRHSPELVMRKMRDGLQGLVMYRLAKLMEDKDVKDTARMKAMDMVLKLSGVGAVAGINVNNFINIAGSKSAETPPVIETEAVEVERRTPEQRAAGVPRRQRKLRSPKRIAAAQ